MGPLPVRGLSSWPSWPRRGAQRRGDHSVSPSASGGKRGRGFSVGRVMRRGDRLTNGDRRAGLRYRAGLAVDPGVAHQDCLLGVRGLLGLDQLDIAGLELARVVQARIVAIVAAHGWIPPFSE